MLSSIAITLAAIIIKIYFIPQTDQFLELSIKKQMQDESVVFERLILTVVRAAGHDPKFVRRALFAISEDPEIRVELLRSALINAQFGPKKGARKPLEFEKEVFREGRPVFRKSLDNFEYAYPLRARPVCQNCHVDPAGRPVESGYVLGVAVKRVSRNVLRESSLTYFVMDMFWENLLLVSLALAVVLGFIQWKLVRPISRMAERFQEYFARDDVHEKLPQNELEILEKGVEHILKTKDSDPDS